MHKGFLFSLDLENDEELLQIEDDIQELKKQNTDLESEMIKMRSEVSSLENHVLQQEKENNEMEEQNTRLEDYLDVLKKESIALLSKLNIPHFNPALVTDENLEACIKQIQNLCSSQSGGGGGGANYYSAVSIGASEIQVAWAEGTLLMLLASIVKSAIFNLLVFIPYNLHVDWPYLFLLCIYV